MMGDYNGVVIKINHPNEEKLIKRWCLWNGVKEAGFAPVGKCYTPIYVAIINYTHPFVCVSSTPDINKCYLCSDIYEFIYKSRCLIKKYHPQKCIVPQCSISELPDIVKEMAIVRLREYKNDDNINISKCTINSFHWDSTPESRTFWSWLYYREELPPTFDFWRLRFDFPK